jgi:hypothetical protein
MELLQEVLFENRILSACSVAIAFVFLDTHKLFVGSVGGCYQVADMKQKVILILI